MLIKAGGSRDAPTGLAGPAILGVRRSYLLILALILGAAAVYRFSTRGRTSVEDVALSAVTWAGSLSVTPRAMNIRLSFENLAILAWNRQRALERGILVKDEDSWVPARIGTEDRSLKAKIRLKGDVIDHLEGAKWSYRIRISGGEAVFGMSTFSIQDPVRSAFVYEWLLHELARREGLVAPRYDFIQVSINGKPIGIHALEESFSKELLAASRRRDGPILRFDESYLMNGDPPAVQADAYYSADVDSFGSNRLAHDPVFLHQFEVARDLLEGVRDQRLTIGQAFNLERTATYFALLDLCEAHHAARWKNIRFYYDPVAARLEPIPYNAYSAASAETAFIVPTYQITGRRNYGLAYVPDWMNCFFEDPGFYRAYVRELDRMSDPGFVPTFLAEIDGALQRNLRIVQRDDPRFAFSDEYLNLNARHIHNNVRPRIPIRVRHDPDAGGRPRLLVANNLWLVIELESIVDVETRQSYPFPEGSTIGPKRSDVLVDAGIALPDEARLPFADFRDGRFALTYRVLGLDTAYAAPVQTHREDPVMGLVELASRASEKAPALEWLHFDEGSRIVEVEAGTWRLDRTLFIPAGFTVEMGPGTTIELHDGASLISWSPLRLTGTADSPVVIRAAEGGSAGGVAVIGAAATSTLEHVQFIRLGEPRAGSWTTTGAVTFDESPVTISDCLFEGGRSEDQLNVVRTSFTVERTELVEAAGDAIDVDFGEGTIRLCRFVRPGNDALDVSGTRVSVSECRIEAAGDKGLSVGEASQAQVEDLAISDSRYGLVSKDLSTLDARRVTIAGGEIGVAVFQKKPEYGPASAVLNDVRIVGAGEATVVGKGSWIVQDGRRHDGTKLGIAQRLYGAEP